MKTIAQINFSINVRKQELEEDLKFSDFYRGIYSITLNKLIDISFVPEVNRDEKLWPPVVPDNVDNPKSSQEARLWTIGLSKYTITPNSNWAGQQEVINLFSPYEDFKKQNYSAKNGIIFYVTPQEFDKFSQELSEISMKTMAVYSYVELSEISSLLFSQFLLKTIISSNNFSPKDLEILKR